jgi:hypothetical protein
MLEKRSPTTAQEGGQVDHTGVLLLLDHEAQRPWSEQEADRETSRDDKNNLARLHVAGALDRLVDFVCATGVAPAFATVGILSWQGKPRPRPSRSAQLSALHGSSVATARRALRRTLVWIAATTARLSAAISISHSARS